MVFIPSFLRTLLCSVALLPAYTLLTAQSIGSKVSVTAKDGKSYTGVIQNISGGNYQVKYDGYSSMEWLTPGQFKLITSANLIGKKVSMTGGNGSRYTGIIQEMQADKYRIKYEGYEFEAWLSSDQFTLADEAAGTPTYTSAGVQTQASSTGAAAAPSLQAIYDFGQQKGWSSSLYRKKFNQYINGLSGKDQQALLVFLKQATTSSARFFALKSLLTGDTYDLVQIFINQLNQQPESYQQEYCLVTNRRSIIQQWQFSCSIAMLQTFLADLSPRYAWEMKHVASYHAISNDPGCVIAQQQKQLLEKYGGVATPRGDVSGTAIGVIQPLADLLTPILGVRFYAQEVQEPLPNVFTKVRAQLDRGINTPLLIGLGGSQNRHFILAMRYRKTAAGYEYLIYDPWEGQSDYVSEASMLRGSLAPLLSQWAITVDYYYPVSD